jgi:hypothetical protein
MPDTLVHISLRFAGGMSVRHGTCTVILRRKPIMNRSVEVTWSDGREEARYLSPGSWKYRKYEIRSPVGTGYYGILDEGRRIGFVDLANGTYSLHRLETTHERAVIAGLCNFLLDLETGIN